MRTGSHWMLLHKNTLLSKIKKWEVKGVVESRSSRKERKSQSRKRPKRAVSMKKKSLISAKWQKERKTALGSAQIQKEGSCASCWAVMALRQFVVRVACWVCPLFYNERRKSEEEWRLLFLHEMTQEGQLRRGWVSSRSRQRDRDKAESDGSSVPGTVPRIPAEHTFIMNTISWQQDQEK